MAPPFTLTLLMSGCSSRSQANTTDANASLISTRSIWSSVSPARSRTLAVAGIGPVSMVMGSTPARAKLWNRARGRSPSAFAFSSLMIRTAAAPSVICDELPAVTLPSSLNAGLSLARDSRLLSGRMPSSRTKTSLPLSVSTVTGTISFSNRPSSVARAARLWLSTLNASSSSRLMPHLSAISSAEMPWGTSPPAAA